ncbi:MAG: MFS transporter, partial [Planctomycetota bacterium]
MSSTPPPPRPLLGVPAGVWGLSAVILVNRAGTMVMPFLSLYLTQKLGLPKESAGIVIATYGAGAMVGVMLGGYLSDRIGPATVMLTSLVLSAVALLILGGLRTSGDIQVCLFLFAVVADMFRPANAAAIATACPARYQSRAFAVQRLAVNAGMTIGPAIGGYLA